MIPVVDDQGRSTNATAITALVVTGAGSDIIQVRVICRDHKVVL